MTSTSNPGGAGKSNEGDRKRRQHDERSDRTIFGDEFFDGVIHEAVEPDWWEILGFEDSDTPDHDEDEPDQF